MATRRRLTDSDYARLLAVRTRLRTFEQWSAQRAVELGLTPAQHQLLLAIRGHDGERGPTIGNVADYLLIRHNTAGELVDRTERQGYIERSHDTDDRRVVRLALTGAGRNRLAALAEAHIAELARLQPLIVDLVADLEAR
jgi:DNA-binding MarR family transcriptional regulator